VPARPVIGITLSAMCTPRLVPALLALVAILSGWVGAETAPTTQPSTVPATRPSGEFEPRKDASSKTGYYIPRDLDDALVEVDRISSAPVNAKQ
jgi:hypothetical protein